MMSQITQEDISKNPAFMEYFSNVEIRKDIDKTISDIETIISTIETARYNPEVKESVDYDLLLSLSTEMQDALIEELQYVLKLGDTYGIQKGNLKRFYLEEILDVDVLTDGIPRTSGREYFTMLKNTLIEGRIYFLEHMLYRLENIMSKELNL
jgi:hypothetical protein